MHTHTYTRTRARAHTHTHTQTHTGIFCESALTDARPHCCLSSSLLHSPPPTESITPTASSLPAFGQVRRNWSRRGRSGCGEPVQVRPGREIGCMPLRPQSCTHPKFHCPFQSTLDPARPPAALRFARRPGRRLSPRPLPRRLRHPPSPVLFPPPYLAPPLHLRR